LFSDFSMTASEAVVAGAEAVPLVDGVVEVAAMNIDGAVWAWFAARLGVSHGTRAPLLVVETEAGAEALKRCRRSLEV
jgi:hypothetical protein